MIFKCWRCGHEWKNLDMKVWLRLGCPCGESCCFCGCEIMGHGHNPAPFLTSNFRCCDNCNVVFVIPARLAQAQGESE